jgi:putative ABC transport system permease protein
MFVETLLMAVIINRSRDGKPVSFQEFIVDTAFLRMMNIQVLSTNTAYSKDGMWLNQAALKTLGLDSLHNYFQRYGQQVPVLGVMKDFNFQPLYREVGPLMIGQLQEDRWPWSILVEMDGTNLITTVDRVKKEYSDFNGGVPFDYKFMDEAINSWYVKEVQTSKIVGYFTLLTILIAVMGIFAMSVFYLQQKVKEVGIRKVNGAKVVEVMAMQHRFCEMGVGRLSDCHTNCLPGDAKMATEFCI